METLLWNSLTVVSRGLSQAQYPVRLTGIVRLPSQDRMQWTNYLHLAVIWKNHSKGIFLWAGFVRCTCTEVVHATPLSVGRNRSCWRACAGTCAYGRFPCVPQVAKRALENKDLKSERSFYCIWCGTVKVWAIKELLAIVLIFQRQLTMWRT